MKTLLFAGLLAAGLMACGSSDMTPTSTLTFGAVFDRTGTLAQPNWGDAANLAVSDANSALSTAGKSLQFKLLLSDSTNTPAVSVTRATDLVRNQGAKAILIDSSKDDIAVNQLYYDADPTNELNVPLVCILCSSPTVNNPAATNTDPIVQNTLRNGLGWNFNTQMTSALLAQVQVKIVLGRNNGDANNDGQFKIDQYTTSAPGGFDYEDQVTAYSTMLHPTPAVRVERILVPSTLDVNTYAFGSDIAKLIDAHNENTNMDDGFADYIMPSMFSQLATAFVKTYLTSGNVIPLFFNATIRRTQVLTDLGSLFNGQEGISYVVLDNGASGDVFAAELTAATSHAPVAADANAYDAAMLTMLASLVATKGAADPTQLTGQQLRDALKLINNPAGTVIRTGPAEFAKAVALIDAGSPINYEGASGPLDFDANGGVLNRVVHWTVENAQFVDKEKYDCIKSPSCPVIP